MTLRAKLTATFVTLVAALALCAGLATPAFATPSSGKTTNSNGITELTLQKTLTVEGATSLASNQTVSFTAMAATPTVDTLNGSDLVAGIGTITIADITFGANEDESTSDGNYSVTKETTVTLPSDASWEANKAYYYQIKENELSGFNVSPGCVDLILYTDNDSSNPKVVAATVSSGNSKTNLAFTNTHSTSAHELKVTKAVAGNRADADEKFTFELTIYSGGTGSLYQDGMTILATITNDGATTTQQVTIGTACEISLKAGGQFTINIPDGLEYSVAETGAGSTSGGSTNSVAGNGYIPTLKIDDVDTTLSSNSTSTGTTYSANGTMGSTDTVWAFLNTRNDTTITGIVLNNAPYIAVFAVAAVGLVAFILKRHRNAEDE